MSSIQVGPDVRSTDLKGIKHIQSSSFLLLASSYQNLKSLNGKLASIIEKKEEVYYSQAFPADEKRTKGLCNFIKLASLGVMGLEGYVQFTLVKHIYQFVTQVNREPEIVLILSFFYLACSLFRTCMAAAGFYYASNHTYRTTLNMNMLAKTLTLSIVLSILVNGAVSFFLYWHIKNYQVKHGRMEPSLHHFITIVIYILTGQAVGATFYKYLFTRLQKTESKLPKVVDTKAANLIQ
uniref:Uncharacterized protein n=1 Tax=Sterkiella nova TaxID=200597 RepID=Q9U4D9_STENO|nr:unknown protein [Sterkiella nova]